MDADTHDREAGQTFMPRFDAHGLIAAVVQDVHTRQVLMVAWMNADALAATRETGFATFWSRSRRCLWRKGETSGNQLAIREIRVDCDQDTLLVLAQPQGPACHTGAVSCFYRTLEGEVLSSVRD